MGKSRIIGNHWQIRFQVPKIHHIAWFSNLLQITGAIHLNAWPYEMAECGHDQPIWSLHGVADIASLVASVLSRRRSVVTSGHYPIAV